jgi:hypothetical protein
MAQPDLGVIRNRMTAVRQSFPELRAVLLASLALRHALRQPVCANQITESLE